MQELNNGGLDLGSLRVLRSLFETRSTTRTAERLNMSQPAVSRALAKLRAALGDPILIKGPGGLIPTERAPEIHARLVSALASLDDLLVPPIFEPACSTRSFRIATTDYGALAVLPRLVRALAEAAPSVSLEVLGFSPDAFRQLGEGRVDFVLYSDDEVPLPLRSRRLYREDYTSLVRAGHPALQRPADLDEFLAWPHVLVSILGGLSGVVDDALAAMGRTRRISLWLPYFATAAHLVAQTNMIMTLPSRAAEPLMRAGDLAAFPPPLSLEGFDYRLLWHERSQADLGHRWLRELLFAKMS